ncbi:hypothetical protein DYJ25_01970 [Prevotella denticola]|nr:hypothetical protein DYJ25_01970 [Prevotella denticola]
MMCRCPSLMELSVNTSCVDGPLLAMILPGRGQFAAGEKPCRQYLSDQRGLSLWKQCRTVSLKEITHEKLCCLSFTGQH